MKKDFGITQKGEYASLYTLSNKKGMKIAVSDYGATLVSILIADKDGRIRDVVLGYDDVAGYEKGGAFFGAIIGRNANRIKGACFTINGKTYELTQNNFKNNLHSGLDFYSKRMWKVEEADEKHIMLTLDSPDGDQGYPGKAHIEVTYTLTDENEVTIHYHGTADADTIFNITNHSYFNLNGHESGEVLGQKVWIDADTFTPSDEETVPTGVILPVEGTPMDFRLMKTLGRDIEEDYIDLKFGRGYDRNYVLNGEGFRKAAEMLAEESGIRMEVYTDLPGMQLYTANYVEDETGKGGARYHWRHGVCFETQYFPDAVNKPQFQSPVVKAGDAYDTTTTFKFY